MKIKRSSPTLEKSFYIIAHRGDSKGAPENTQPAFRRAIDTGADMIEFDVQLSSDGVPVVFHDTNLDKHSNGRGRLSDFPVDKLRLLDVGSWYSEEFSEEKIPLLTEVLELAQNRVLLNIEIKPEAVTHDAETGIEYKVCEQLRRFGMEKQALISSFDYRVFSRIESINPEIKTGLLYNRKKSEGFSPSELVQRYRAFSFHCGRWQLRKKWIKECRDIGVPVFVYTVNDRRSMRSLIKKGVCGIFSDRPERLKKVADKLLSGA